MNTNNRHSHGLLQSMNSGKVEAISEAGGCGAQQSASEILSRAFHMAEGKLSFDLSVRQVIYGETKFEAEQL